MPRYLAAPLPDGCPWSGWMPPNVNWCEEELCALVVNPADTWSNLAYVIFGIWMWRQAKQSPHRSLMLFGPASIAVGAGSFIYHASYTAFFQFFDFVGMFLFCMTIITVNAVRLGWIRADRQWGLLAGGTIAISALVPVVSETPVPIQSMVFVLIVLIVGQEVLAARRRADGAGPVDRRWFYASLGLLGVGAAFSAADVSRVFCDPKDHLLQGHALWHLFTAASLVALFAYHRELGERAARVG